MTVTVAMSLFLVLLGILLSILQVFGGVAVLALVGMVFLFAILVIRVGDARREALEDEHDAAEQAEEEGPPDLAGTPGFAGLRTFLAGAGFAPDHALPFPDMGRYVEIFARPAVFAEVVVDEEDGLPKLAFRTFFIDGAAVATETAQVRYDPLPAPAAGEFHWLPGASPEAALAFHESRVATLSAGGRAVDGGRPGYAEERARSLGDGKSLIKNGGSKEPGALAEGH